MNEDIRHILLDIVEYFRGCEKNAQPESAAARRFAIYAEAVTEAYELSEQDLRDLEVIRKVRAGAIKMKVCSEYTIMNGDWARRHPHRPVVYCQDCRHRLNCLISGGSDGNFQSSSCDPYWYCADGEREGEE